MQEPRPACKSAEEEKPLEAADVQASGTSKENAILPSSPQTHVSDNPAQVLCMYLCLKKEKP